MQQDGFSLPLSLSLPLPAPLARPFLKRSKLGLTLYRHGFTGRGGTRKVVRGLRKKIWGLRKQSTQTSWLVRFSKHLVSLLLFHSLTLSLSISISLCLTGLFFQWKEMPVAGYVGIYCSFCFCFETLSPYPYAAALYLHPPGIWSRLLWLTG